MGTVHRSEHEPRRLRASTVLAGSALLIGINVVSILTHVFSPHRREFSPRDESIAKPYVTHELIKFSFLVSAVVLIVPGIMYFSRRAAGAETKASFFVGVYAFLLSLSTATLIVNVIKVSVGRLRPDFLNRNIYFPSRGASESPEVVEGRRSFPSGHTCAACSSSTHTLLDSTLLMEKAVGRPRLAILCSGMVLPVAFTLVVAVSRITDNRHHPTDVLVGGFIGMCVTAGFFYCFKSKNR